MPRYPGLVLFNLLEETWLPCLWLFTLDALHSSMKNRKEHRMIDNQPAADLSRLLSLTLPSIADSLELPMNVLQAAEIQVAAMIWRNWHHNFYHAFGEDVFHVYNLACKYLHVCDGANRTELTPLFIERYGDYHTPW